MRRVQTWGPSRPAVLNLAQSTGSEKIETADFINFEEYSSLLDLKAAINKFSKSSLEIKDIGVEEGDFSFKQFDFDSSESACTFLRFADLDLSNADHVKEFVSGFGLLLFETNAHREMNFHNNMIGDEITEDFELWILLQLELRLLIRIWRLLTLWSKKNYLDSHFLSFYLIDSDKIDGLIYTDPFLADAYSELKNIERLRNSYEKIGPKSKEPYDDSKKILCLARFFQRRLNHLVELFPEITVLNGVDSDKQYFGAQKSASLLSTRHPVVQKVHTTLFGGILHQFLNAIDQNLTYRRCMECRTWMRESTKGPSGKNIYCSGSHKASAAKRRADWKLLLDVQPNLIPDIKLVFNDIADAFRNKDLDLYNVAGKKLLEIAGESKELRTRLVQIQRQTFFPLGMGATKDSVQTHLGEAGRFFPDETKVENEFIFHMKQINRHPAYFDWDWEK